MFIELERAEHALLLELIRNRIDELAASTRRIAGDSEDRRTQIESWERLLRKLHEAEWEVTC